MMMGVMGQCLRIWRGTAVARECTLELLSRGISAEVQTVPPCTSHSRVTTAPTPDSKQVAISKSLLSVSIPLLSSNRSTHLPFLDHLLGPLDSGWGLCHPRNAGPYHLMAPRTEG